MLKSVVRLCVASSLALGFAFSLAGTPVAAADSVLTACINGGNGMMRLVDATQECHRNENRVSWNVTGPEGPAGPPGPEGPTGPAGSAASGPPYVWVCTPVTFANTGGTQRADLNVFNAGASTANVAVHFLDFNGANLAGVSVPVGGGMPPATYPGDSGAATVAVLAAHTRTITWTPPVSSPDPITNVVAAIRVTSDQPISVGAIQIFSGFVPLPCNFVHP
jgi:hypothetical protein